MHVRIVLAHFDRAVGSVWRLAHCVHFARFHLRG
jgi:hypothetical protein